MTAPLRPQSARCVANTVSSRICELGTKSCTVKHSEWNDTGVGAVRPQSAERPALQKFRTALNALYLEVEPSIANDIVDLANAALVEAEAYARAAVEDLQGALERERCLVADGVTAIRKAVEGRDWLTEGRGPYEWNDDRWHSEFAAASQEILAALEPLKKVAADWHMCPTDAESVKKARALLPVGESHAAAPQNESVRAESRQSLTQISVIRKHIENAELGNDHQHGDFETCEVCEQAQKSISYLQITGWQNAIILLRKLDELAAAPAAPLPPESNKP